MVLLPNSEEENMATRSSISIRREDGTYSSIYCHYDGYPSHNGRILQEFYNTPQLVEALMGLGDLSQLAERLAPAPGESHRFESPANGVCIAYGRDRGELNASAREYPSSAEFKAYNQKQEYNYVFDCETNQWRW